MVQEIYVWNEKIIISSEIFFLIYSVFLIYYQASPALTTVFHRLFL